MAMTAILLLTKAYLDEVVQLSVQSPSENRTNQYSNGHFSDTFSVRISDAFENQTRRFLITSLDRFGMNKIFFCDPY